MSSHYYFERWKKTLSKLEGVISLDMEYKETKAHDKKLCDATLRLTSMLGSYMYIYNETVDCYQHNLQVQKTEYMIKIIRAIVARILELKVQLRKLVASEYQFMSRGLIDHKLTTYDAELSDVPPKLERAENITKLIAEAIQKAKERKEHSHIVETELIEPEEKISQKPNWWDDNPEDAKEESPRGINVAAIYEVQEKEEISVEMQESTKMIILIQAHERFRKLRKYLTHQRHKREKWEKELNGTLKPPARYEMRVRSARLIQKICRIYFEIKRKRIQDCKRDEILNIRLCEKICCKDNAEKLAEWNERSTEKIKEYNKEWAINRDTLKQHFIKRKRDVIEDDIREEIMHWFRKWYDEVSFFHEIPNEDQGGSVLIVKEELPSPSEWLEQYEAYLEEKRANKNKSAYDLKWEKLEAKKQLKMEKKAEHAKKKMEEELLKKLMKNPDYHPGYYYPESKKIEHILEAMEDYKKDWSDLDISEIPEVKEKSVIDIDISNAYMDAKMEIRKTIDEDMRENLKLLQNALKQDYKRNDEKMPEQIKEKNRRKKKKPKRNVEVNENIVDKLEDLAFRGFLKEYPRTKIEDFIGDPNFAGDDLRCLLQPSQAFSGETRSLWWERCREIAHGSHNILLVGAKGSGKTTLVYALASVNDAVLYEIDSAGFPEELFSTIYLQQLANTIAACAKATQPSVIYIKHVHRLYYTKVPPEEDSENLNLISRYLLRKLFKKINKKEKIAIVASCIDPWVTKTKMLKQFPNVVLLPETNYSAVSIILRNWVLEIAAHGLSLDEIYDYFLNSSEEKVDYERYLKWYTEKSNWGKKEKKHLEEQREFQDALIKWQEKKKKKKNVENTISDVSTNVSSNE
ncbi:IQ and AAA domain-containing protein 1-like isoform X2 [Epargyreus clarus]|uniref:IQ and AAA domain-containing protein 1-like isoform X2 n=1 Tax=Epargyreus clarus TaxID=520877 RepID=UPI003C2FD4FF